MRRLLLLAVFAAAMSCGVVSARPSVVGQHQCRAAECRFWLAPGTAELGQVAPPTWSRAAKCRPVVFRRLNSSEEDQSRVSVLRVARRLAETDAVRAATAKSLALERVGDALRLKAIDDVAARAVAGKIIELTQQGARRR
jgi:hypothetical protein